MNKKGISEYEATKARKQLKSMDRYVDAKVLLRKLKSEGVDVSAYLVFLDGEPDEVGRHYTLTEDEFNEIKKFYEEKKTVQ